MTSPNAEGVIHCIADALKDSNIEPKDIDLISGHLTATMADKMEIENWAAALDRKGDDFPSNQFFEINDRALPECRRVN